MSLAYHVLTNTIKCVSINTGKDKTNIMFIIYYKNNQLDKYRTFKSFARYAIKYKQMPTFTITDLE